MPSPDGLLNSTQILVHSACHFMFDLTNSLPRYIAGISVVEIGTVMLLYVSRAKESSTRKKDKNMRPTALFIFMLSLVGCASGPSLYTPVLSMSDGNNVTESRSSDENVTVVRVTRNAERWCKHYHNDPRYIVDALETTYHGILGSAEAARQATAGTNVARRISSGVPIIGARSESDWKTVLVFRCANLTAE